MPNFLQPDSLRQAKKEGLFTQEPSSSYIIINDLTAFSNTTTFILILAILPYKLFQCRTCLTYIVIPVF
jgi:hypothetical protein